jgi:hypothetical protein
MRKQVQRAGWDHIREHQAAPPQMVHGHVPAVFAQKRGIFPSDCKGHRGDTENRMVHAPQDTHPAWSGG